MLKNSTLHRNVLFQKCCLDVADDISYHSSASDFSRTTITATYPASSRNLGKRALAERPQEQKPSYGRPRTLPV